MRKWNWQVGMVIGAVALLAWLGCQKPKEASRDGKTSTGKSMRDVYQDGMRAQKNVKGEDGEKERHHPVRPPEPPPALKMPVVNMPETLLETCLVKVGDRMPEAELADLQNKRVSLGSLLGKKLTVVLFWNSENLYATQALEYAGLEVAEPFGKKGVVVIGVDVKDAPEAARKAVADAGAKYVNLLDPEGRYFGKVATDTKKVPRVYLLDPSGKVLWHDVEYSVSTRRDLERAIKFVLGEK
jgi:peroxiredoxin